MYCLVCLLDVSMLLQSPLGSVCNLVTGAVFNEVGGRFELLFYVLQVWETVPGTISV